MERQASAPADMVFTSPHVVENEEGKKDLMFPQDLLYYSNPTWKTGAPAGGGPKCPWYVIDREPTQKGRKCEGSFCRGIRHSNLRFGSYTESKGYPEIFWRNIRCVTKLQLQNVARIYKVAHWSDFINNHTPNITHTERQAITTLFQAIEKGERQGILEARKVLRDMPYTQRSVPIGLLETRAASLSQSLPMDVEETVPQPSTERMRGPKGEAVEKVDDEEEDEGAVEAMDQQHDTELDVKEAARAKRWEARAMLALEWLREGTAKHVFWVLNYGYSRTKLERVTSSLESLVDQARVTKELAGAQDPDTYFVYRINGHAAKPQ